VNREKGETLQGKERIGKQGDIKRLFERGTRYYSKQYTLILLQNGLNWLRLAVSIRRKVGGAAVRNYEKRVCREFFRKEKHRFQKGIDILIIVKSKTDNFHSTYVELKGLFNRGFHIDLDNREG